MLKKGEKRRKTGNDEDSDQVAKQPRTERGSRRVKALTTQPSLIDCIFGQSSTCTVSRPEKSQIAAQKRSKLNDLFAMSTSLPVRQAMFAQPQTTTQKSTVSSSAIPSSRQPRQDRSKIIQQRKRQSQHPLIRSSLDFPGVFEQDENVNIPFDEQQRVIEMAEAVREYGVCILRQVVDCSLLEHSLAPAAQQLQRKLYHALERRGIAWNTIVSPQPSMDKVTTGRFFRFQEAASRCQGRLDVTLFTDKKRGGGQKGRDAISAIIDTFQIKEVLQNSTIYPVIQNLLGGTNSISDDDDGTRIQLVYAGLIFNLPNSEDQPWHQDGLPLFPEAANGADIQASIPPYALNVFIPLETSDGEVQKGPTEFLPQSHKWSAAQLQNVNSDSTHNDSTNRTSSVMSPILRQGDVLIYDYRVCHRGTSNLAETKPTKDDIGSIVQGTRKILYLMYARPWFTDHVNFDYTNKGESIWDFTEK